MKTDPPQNYFFQNKKAQHDFPKIHTEVGTDLEKTKFTQQKEMKNSGTVSKWESKSNNASLHGFTTIGWIALLIHIPT